MFTVSEWEILSGYRGMVQAARSISSDLSRRLRYGLPLMDLPEQYNRLKMEILQFEKILDRVPDRRARNVLRCRFALGYTIRKTAEYMMLSHTTVDNIIKELKPETSE